MENQIENWQSIPRITARVLALGFTFLWGIRLLEHYNATNPDIASLNPVVYWAIAFLLAGLLAGLVVGWMKEWIGGWMVLGFGGLYFILSGHWRLWPLAFGTLFTGLIWANLGWLNQFKANGSHQDPNLNSNQPTKPEAGNQKQPVENPKPVPEGARPSSPTDL